MFTVWPDLHPRGPQCEGGPSPLTVALPPGADQWSRCKRRLHSLAHTHCGALRALHRCVAAIETRWIYSCTRYMENTLLLCFKVSSHTHVSVKRFRPKRALFAFIARAFVTGASSRAGETARSCALFSLIVLAVHPVKKYSAFSQNILDAKRHEGLSCLLLILSHILTQMVLWMHLRPFYLTHQIPQSAFLSKTFGFLSVQERPESRGWVIWPLAFL